MYWGKLLYVIGTRKQLLSLAGLMDFLAAKDKAEGFRGQRGTWEADENARKVLRDRASKMLLFFEKRRLSMGKKV